MSDTPTGNGPDNETPANPGNRTPPPYRPPVPGSDTTPPPPPPQMPPPPPAPPPAPPSWPTPPSAPNPWQPGADTAVQWPVGPPTGGPPGGPPSQPPIGPSGGAPGAPASTPASRKGRVGVILGIVVVLCLIAGGVIAALAVSNQGSGAFTVTVDKCTIAADGTVVASGRVSSDERSPAEVKVNFRDADTSGDLGTKSQTVESSWDGTVWTASTQVGDDVQKVTCTAST